MEKKFSNSSGDRICSSFCWHSLLKNNYKFKTNRVRSEQSRHITSTCSWRDCTSSWLSLLLILYSMGQPVEWALIHKIHFSNWQVWRTFIFTECSALIFFPYLHICLKTFIKWWWLSQIGNYCLRCYLLLQDKTWCELPFIGTPGLKIEWVISQWQCLQSLLLFTPPYDETIFAP